MADIQGTYDGLSTAVPGALAALLDDGDWGGFADAGRTVPWQRDTVVNVEALLVLSALADAGLVIPAARATAAAVAKVAAHALFTCLRKSPPGDEVPGEFPLHPAGGGLAHMRVHPRNTEYAGGDQAPQ